MENDCLYWKMIAYIALFFKWGEGVLMQKAYVKYLSSHPSEYDFQVCEMSNKSLVTAHT